MFNSHRYPDRGLRDAHAGTPWGPHLEEIGLQLEQYRLLETFLLPDATASKVAHLRFKQIFGDI